jgi:protein PhnA
MNNPPPCPLCGSDFAYEDGTLFVCPDCGHEWAPGETVEAPASTDEQVLDANGMVLKNGDDVILTQGLKVRGSPHDLKKGTKVKNIRIHRNGDHNIDCRIDGLGSMALKSEFVRKA